MHLRLTAGTSSRSWCSSPGHSRSPATSSITSRRSRSGRATTRSGPSSRAAAAVTPGQGQAVTIAGVQVGLVGGVQLENGRAVVTMNIFKKYAPIYRERDRAAPPAHAAEGHVPRARPGDQADRRRPGRRHAGRGQHDPGRRSRPDPGLARRRHAELPAVAAVGRRRRVPEPGVERRRAAGHVQAVRAARTATRERSRRCSRRGATTSDSRSTTFNAWPRRSAASTASSRR